MANSSLLDLFPISTLLPPLAIAWKTHLKPRLLAFLALWNIALADGPAFRVVGPASGVDFRFADGSRGRHDLPEIMGGGVAMIDVDGDGRLDLYFCNGGPIAPKPGDDDPPCRLYRNEGGWRFREITATANAPGPSYAMGAAVGDYDGDGRDDLVVTGWRDQRLYRNLGDGSFVDVTEKAGLISKLWSTSAAFADLDDDGDLDLYVCNYLRYDPEKAPYCAAPDGRRDYCGPEDFDPEPDRLYRNNGDGTFTEIGRAAGLIARDGRGLGVLIADLVGDTRPDVYVANDGSPCLLYENRGAMQFVEVAGRVGVALDGEGRALAGMGVAAGDVDGDGLSDLFVSNFLGRSTIGFRNLDGAFVDDSTRLGLSRATSSVLGFGLALEDFDGDGDLDMIQANGHVLDRERLGQPFAMKPTLLNNQNGRFLDADPVQNAFLGQPIVGRGLAVGDLDGDGKPDVVIGVLRAPALVMQNVTDGGDFVSLEIEGKRNAVGARITATIGGRRISRMVVSGGSYASASDRRIGLSFGKSSRKDVEVTWPSGKTERFLVPDGARKFRLLEGMGVHE